MSYVPPPRDLPAFPQFFRAKRKTPTQGGGGLRSRWKNNEGLILEWDSRHGTVEMYDRRGKHLGEFDPLTGEQLASANPAREVEP